jgi:hypothetical protein
MKKIVLLCLLSAVICGGLFAQSNAQTTTIRGTLTLSGGKISVTSGNIIYYVRGLQRFVGFIDGLKEGAQVSLDGYVSTPSIDGQKDRLFYPITLALNGKNYEVGSPTVGNMAGRNGKSAGYRGRRR